MTTDALRKHLFAGIQIALLSGEEAPGVSLFDRRITLNPCERYAHFTLQRDAGFFALAAVTMMVAFSFESALAMDIGASVALLFAIIQLTRFSRLTEERFRRCEVWRALRPDERPAGEHGVRIAMGALQDQMLRFAKTASGAAVTLYGSGLTFSMTFGFQGL